jgi:hypothetical protein
MGRFSNFKNRASTWLSRRTRHLRPENFSATVRYRRYLEAGYNYPAVLRHLWATHGDEALTARVSADVERAREIHDALLQAVDLAEGESQGFDVPKTIWMFWDKGLANAPDVVKIAYESWVKLNPDYEVRFLDNDSLSQVADFAPLFHNASLQLGLAHRSDYVRTYLLARFGGVWVDSTSFCWKPLSEWLPDATKETGFFVFRQPSSRPDRQLANWFIVSSRGNPLTCAMFRELDAFVFRPRDILLTMRKYKYYSHYSELSRTGTGYPLLQTMEREGWYPYHFYHYLFNVVVAKGQCRDIWEKVGDYSRRYVSSHGPLGEVYVSKQTYRGKYQASATYRERVQKLRELLRRYDSADQQ